MSARASPHFSTSCIRGLTMRSLPEAHDGLLSKTAISAFWDIRQDTPRSGECNDKASHTPSAGISVCLSPLANMPKDRQSALREGVRAAGVAVPDSGIATPSKSFGGALGAPPPSTQNESSNDEIENF